MPNVSFYRQTTGSTVEGAITFDTTNKKIYVGDGSTAHAFEGTDSKNQWIALNSTTGISLSDFWSTTKDYYKAQEICIKLQSIPQNMLYANCSSTSKSTTSYIFLHWNGITTAQGFYYSSCIVPFTDYVSRSSGISRVYNSKIWLTRTGTTTANFTHQYQYFTSTNATTYSFTGMGTEKKEVGTTDISPYLKVIAVKY